MTLNNFTEDEYNSLRNLAESDQVRFYIIGREIGSEGTPHLQMFFEFRNQKTFDQVKNYNRRMHLETTRGSNDKNYKYCSKEGNFITNIQGPELTFQERNILALKEEYRDVVWREWQVQVLQILDGPRDARKINWVYDPKGNSGKSFLCRYIDLHYECVIADGKRENIFNQLCTECIENNRDITTVILDTPRTMEGYVSYGAIEQLKDGLIYSGKYKGGKVYLIKPHVFIFSNYLPDTEKFTEDRWNIIHV